MVLDPARPANTGLPKIYKIHMGDHDTANTFIFSEQDLPEFKKKAKKEEQAAAAAAAGANANGVKKYTRFRKTVPSKTRTRNTCWACCVLRLTFGQSRRSFRQL